MKNRLVFAKGLGEGRKNWEFGMSKCKVLHIGWINMITLFSGTGNYIQYPVISHNGKEYKKGMSVCN